ncbi:MAG TPA: glutamine--tRNA ligase/YqeY domain fusion protein, partial [Caldilineaceae bacterium]|nr:glutamine--tRNA ligase/YqeY domain fusion protein [Caldilineaceae bacterium]
LRAKIDMASPNMKMRDPLLYRIRHAHHYRTGDQWCIYPMYDYAHPLSDAIEGITHSICTLEFENNREVYDWVVENCRVPPKPYPRPYQHEFARLNLDYTVMSKRKLLELVEGNYVRGWDDPRLPTLAGLRRCGVTAAAIRDFAERIGVAKANSRVELSLLDSCIRDDLNTRAPRVLAVLRPLKVVITNYPAGQVEQLEAPYWPHDVPNEGSRLLPFARELFIERDDFMEEPPKNFFRLAPGREVRLRYAYIIRCDEVVKDASGEIVELRCSYDLTSQGGATADGRKVKGTIHWVSAAHAVPAEVRIYDRLFTVSNPDEAPEGHDFKEYLNPNSLQVLRSSLVEPSLAEAAAGSRFQFERHGYFVVDSEDSRPGALVFNRIIDLRDSWAKVAQAEGASTTRGRPQPTPAAKTERAAGAGDEAASGARSLQREQARQANPALAARFAEYGSRLGLSPEDADILSGDSGVADFFERAVAVHPNPKLVANWVINDVLRELKEKPVTALPFTGEALGALAALIDQGAISTAAAKEVFAEMLASGDEPTVIVERKGLHQVADPEAIAPVIEQVLNVNADKAAQYRAGKTGLLGFFVGQVMKQSGGKANPQLVQELVRAKLG